MNTYSVNVLSVCRCFPEYNEVSIVTAVYKGNYDETRREINALLCGDEGAEPLPQIVYQCLYHNLLSTAFKIIKASSGNDADSLLINRELTDINTTDDMINNILLLYQRIHELLVPSRRSGNSNSKKNDIVEYVEKNCFDDNISLQSLSDVFCVTQPYLSKFLKAKTGYKFIDFVGIKRTSQAKHLLMNTNKSIEQIGKEVGYYNPLTFRRAFKKYVGINPGEYRAIACAAS